MFLSWTGFRNVAALSSVRTYLGLFSVHCCRYFVPLQWSEDLVVTFVSQMISKSPRLSALCVYLLFIFSVLLAYTKVAIFQNCAENCHDYDIIFIVYYVGLAHANTEF